MDNMLYDAIEKLNKEKQEILKSKEYKTGKNIYETKSILLKLNIKKLFKNVKGKMIGKKILKNYFHPDKCEIVYNNIDYKVSKIAIYTCIIGDYDNIQIPLINFDNVDFYLFTDNIDKYKKYSDIYKIVRINDDLIKLGSINANRYVKFHPSEFLKEYDYSIYIDGNVRIVSDVRKFVSQCNPKTGIAMHIHRERNDIYEEATVCKLLKRGNANMINCQIEKYRKDGFPKEYGMNEATIIVSDLKNSTCTKLLSDWYSEFIESKSLRDQLAWPYVLWKNNFKINDVGNLGNNIYENYKIEIVKHL